MNQQDSFGANPEQAPRHNPGGDAVAAVRADESADLQSLRAANPESTAGVSLDELTLRRMRTRVMAEAGITTSPVIPAQTHGSVERGLFANSFTRLRHVTATPTRALVAVAASAAMVMTGVVVWPSTTPDPAGLSANGTVDSQMNSADAERATQDDVAGMDQAQLSQAQAPADELPQDLDVATDRLRAKKMAVRDSCFGDAAADALQCGYPMVDYGTKLDTWQSMPAIEAEPNAADVYLPMTVAVDKPRQRSASVEKSRLVVQFDTSIRISNPHDSDATFGSPVLITQELLVDGAWFACDIVDADTGSWLGSVSGSHAELTSLRAGETATRTVATRCTLDSDINPYGMLTPRTLVSVADHGALLFRTS